MAPKACRRGHIVGKGTQGGHDQVLQKCRSYRKQQHQQA